MHLDYKRIGSIALILIGIGILFSNVLAPEVAQDKVSFEGEEYYLLDYPADIFAYDYISDKYMEEDVVYPVDHAPWKMVYTNCDMYVCEQEEEAAELYYSDDASYEWCITIESDDKETTKELKLNESEIASLYQLESQKKSLAIFWEEIEKFGTLKKVSEDGIIQGSTELAYYDGTWYWRTEIIDESREENDTWPEYVQKLPESFSKKIEENN